MIEKLTYAMGLFVISAVFIAIAPFALVLLMTVQANECGKRLWRNRG